MMRITIATFVLFVSLSFMGVANAQAGALTSGSVCQIWWDACQKKTPSGPPCSPPIKTCTASGGIGHCEQTICVGDTAAGLDGKQAGLDKGLEGLMGALQSILGKLGQGKGGSGAGGGQPGGGGSPTAQNPLAPERADNTNSLLDAVNDVTDTIATGAEEAQDTVTNILDSVFGKEGIEVTNENNNGTEDSQDINGEVTVENTTEGNNTTGSSTPLIPKAEDEERTETRTTGTTATFEAGVRDAESNSEVSGFYGNSVAEQPKEENSLFSRLCTSRPWANGILSYIIGPDFFDGLCTRIGYEPGEVAQPQPTQDNGGAAPVSDKEATKNITQETLPKEQGVGVVCTPKVVRPDTEVTIAFSCGANDLSGVAGFSIASSAVREVKVKPKLSTQYAIKCSDEKVYACTVQVVNPKLTIAAEPAAVQLNSRTVIRWSSQDVVPESCTVKGPSFSERGSFGVASTVPINDTSTFTFSCMGLDGATTTQTLAVDLAI